MKSFGDTWAYSNRQICISLSSHFLTLLEHPNTYFNISLSQAAAKITPTPLFACMFFNDDINVQTGRNF